MMKAVGLEDRLGEYTGTHSAVGFTFDPTSIIRTDRATFTSA